MEGLPLAALLSQAVARAEARSALPDAPVVPQPARPSRPHRRPARTSAVVTRGRALLAEALQRAAVAVEPGPAIPPQC